MNAPKDRKDLVTLLREENFHPEGSSEDEEDLDEMVEELADELGIQLDD